MFYSCIYLFFLIIYVFINLFILKHSREFDKILSNSFRFFNQNRAASLAPGIFLLCCILYFSSVSKVTLKDCFFYSFGGEFLFIFLARKSKSWCRFEQEFKLLERHWKWMSQTQSHCPRFVYLFVYLFIKKKKTCIQWSQGRSYAVTIDSEWRTFLRTRSEHLAAVSMRRAAPAFCNKIIWIDEAQITTRLLRGGEKKERCG